MFDSSQVFRHSFTRMFTFDGDVALGGASNAIFEVIHSRDVKVAGTIGPVASMEKMTPVRVCVCP